MGKKKETRLNLGGTRKCSADTENITERLHFQNLLLILHG